jgi:proteasome lid subunit RPN8/RPN11
VNFSILATIRALAAPKYRLSCSISLWHYCLAELKRRGEGYHESGAFMLGYSNKNRRVVVDFVFYDDIDPGSLDSGIVEIQAAAFGKLWQICRDRGLEVVGDIHTHPGRPWQSDTDRRNPMVAIQGHIAVIVPNFALHKVKTSELGIYQYLGNHRWQSYLNDSATKFFYVGMFG